MVLPNAESAFIEPDKVRDYLLSSTHPVGRFKAHFFVALGYRAERWETLRDHLRDVARTGIAMPGKPSPFGAKFEVDGILSGPVGRSASIKTVWMLRPDDVSPRFVTAFPR